MASIRNIKKSNKFLTVDFSDFSHEEYHALLHSGSKVEPRRKAAQVLVDYLCETSSTTSATNMGFHVAKSLCTVCLTTLPLEVLRWGYIVTRTSISGTIGILRFPVTSGLSLTPFFMSSCTIMTITISSFQIPFTARDLSRE